KYPDTNVLVEGHTDNTGTDAINQPLSEQRAQSVASALTAQSVASSRITTKGYGSTQAVGDNTTAEGRQANRRVEVAIYANEKMKKAAEAGSSAAQAQDHKGWSRKAKGAAVGGAGGAVLGGLVGGGKGA
nr:hypothetical protein [Tanacetum cinerariifolium]